MADLGATYRILMSNEFKRRCAKNSRYSQSAFAKSLGLDTTYMSKLLKGKILLSLDLAEQITKKLRLSQEEKRDFLLSVAEEQKCHALYLIDPSLTECDPQTPDSNSQPRPRKKLK
jgi:transcriptional regulator with XRE-family HTH domain